MSASQQKNSHQNLILSHIEKRYFFIISLKTVFEYLNLVKDHDKTNPNVFVFNLRDKYRWCGQFS